MAHGKMYTNIIHRVTTELYEPFMIQQEICHKHGIKTTMMIYANGLYDEKVIETLKDENKKYGDEIALSLHRIDSETARLMCLKEEKIWLIEFEKRKKIIDRYFEKFKDSFGFYPISIGAYVLDARTLNYIHDTYPSVKTAITSCFEEGVRMFGGNQHMWHLFSDGGPWGAYYPSKYNSLNPAVDENEFCGIIGLPHLNRDMVMCLKSRDDLFSSHPMNVVRGKAYDLNTGECPYMYDFIDMWLEQLNYNENIYYNNFVAPIWVTDDNMLEETGEYFKKLYEENISYIAFKEQEGKIKIMTMSEFGAWYTDNVKIGSCEVNSWHDIICGSGRNMAWYTDPMMRVCFDGHLGGAICDLRPYAGRIDKNVGPDTNNLDNMNQPYLISAAMRGGVHGGSIHTVKVKINSCEYSLALRRTKFKTVSTKSFVTEPIELRGGGVTAKIQSTFEFNGMGEILITRKLLELSDENADVEFVEYNKTCYGCTEYPKDLRGCTIKISNEKKTDEIDFKYDGREISMNDAIEMQAIYPQINTALQMRIISDRTCGRVEEGYLFSPFISLCASRKMKIGDELKICLKIKKQDR